MRAFNHLNAFSLEEASAALKQPGALAMAGGGDLLGALKDDIFEEYPRLVVNLKTIPGLDKVEVRHGYGDYVKNDGFVTSNCPVAITKLENMSNTAMQITDIMIFFNILPSLHNLIIYHRVWFFFIIK